MTLDAGVRTEHGVGEGRHVPPVPPDLRRESGFGYRPGLDGIRAVAVVAVIAYHLDYGWMRGGFLGVDAFFVLSGYLITSLLLVEHARSGTVSLSAFWSRRMRRLMPPLLVVVAAIAAYAAFWADAETRWSLRGDALSALFYVANWRFISTGQSYFDSFADVSPLRHTWSLAIEEQFYLLWPLLVLLALWIGRGTARVLGAVALVAVLGSALAMAVLQTSDVSRAYYGTDSRIHELLIGSVTAVLVQRGVLRRDGPLDRRPRVWRGLGVASLALVMLALVLVSDTSIDYYRGGSVLFSIAVALLIVSMERAAGGGAARLLSTRPVAWVGAISYGLYLYHWPVLRWVDERALSLRGLLLDSVQVAIVFLVAVASYRLLEKPVRSGRVLRLRLLPRRVFLSGAVALGLAAMAVLTGTRGATPPAWAEGEVGAFVVLGSDRPNAPVIAVVGDSIAKSMLPGLDTAGRRDGVRIVGAAWSGCGIAGQYQLDLDAETSFDFSQPCMDAVPSRYVELVRRFHPDLVFIHSVRERFPLRLPDGRVALPGTTEHRATVVAGIERSVDALRSRGATVVISHVVHRAQRFKGSCANPTQAVRCAADDGRDGVYDSMNSMLDEASAARRGTIVLPLADILCPGGPPCPTRQDGIILRWDGSHLTAPGSHWLGPRLLDALMDIRDRRT